MACALRARWHRRPPTDGFALEGVRPTTGAIEVAFHWRRDPQPYLLRVPHPEFPIAALGEDFDLADAVDEFGWWLEEQLETGFVSWAERRSVADRVLLEAGSEEWASWFVGDVPLEQPDDLAERVRNGTTVVADRGRTPSTPITDPGRHLDEAGLDGSAGRRAAADGSLLAWLQVGGGEAEDLHVGQAVVVRDGDPDLARIVRLETVGAHPDAFDALAWVACRVAVEAGALHVVGPPSVPRLLDFGFRRAEQGLAARFDELRRPDADPGS